MQPNDQDLEKVDLSLSKKPEMAVDGKKKSDKPKKPKKQKWSTKKKVIVWSVVVILLIAAGVGGFFLYRYLTADKSQSSDTSTNKPEKYYSTLSGEEIASKNLDTAPTYCVQIPNGLDGARPQVGLSEAPIVFEAIAEAGITRFAAIFQNPTSSAIGPIRSLRQYYLEWDTPFDCTIVHAGGSDEALDSLDTGGYRDLTEDYTYMWRDNSAYIAPNNLFTSASLLKKFNEANGYDQSNVKSFPRMKPAAAEKARKAAIEDSKDKVETNAAGDEVTVPGTPLVSEIAVNFGYTAAFNTNYLYDEDTGSYLRSYADGVPHDTFTCPEGLDEPSPQQNCGKATQVAPKAIAVIEVDESLDTDGYHEAIRTTGSGSAYVFQNGSAIEGTWSRQSYQDVIKFTDADGKEISFAPGQLWIAAIPASTGSVVY